jgi:hypothetical protein
MTLTVILDIESLEKDASQFSWCDPLASNDIFSDKQSCAKIHLVRFPNPNGTNASQLSVWSLSIYHNLW